MMKCPKCGMEFERLLALSREDGKTAICDECGIKEALGDAGLLDGSSVRKSILKEVGRSKMSHQDRTRAQVYASGNRWAIENFEATHN